MNVVWRKEDRKIKKTDALVKPVLIIGQNKHGERPSQRVFSTELVITPNAADRLTLSLVIVFNPINWLGHLENDSCTLWKNICTESKYLENVIFHFEDQITDCHSRRLEAPQNSTQVYFNRINWFIPETRHYYYQTRNSGCQNIPGASTRILLLSFKVFIIGHNQQLGRSMKVQGTQVHNLVGIFILKACGVKTDPAAEKL